MALARSQEHPQSPDYPVLRSEPNPLAATLLSSVDFGGAVKWTRTHSRQILDCLLPRSTNGHLWMIETEVEKLSSGDLPALFSQLRDEMFLWQMLPRGVLRSWLHQHVHAPNFCDCHQLCQRSPNGDLSNRNGPSAAPACEHNELWI